MSCGLAFAIPLLEAPSCDKSCSALAICARGGAMSGVGSKRLQPPPSDDIDKKRKETLKTHDEKKLATKNRHTAKSIKVGAAFKHQSTQDEPVIS